MLSIKLNSLKPYLSWQLVLLLFINTISGFTEGFGLLLLIPLLTLAGFNFNVASNHGLPNAVHKILQCINIQPNLMEILILYVLVLSLVAGFRYCNTVLTAKTQQTLSRRLRNQLAEAVTFANWSFITRNKISDAINIITLQTEHINYLISQCLQLISGFVVTLVYVSIAFMLSWPMTLITLGFGCLLFFAMRIIHKRTNKTGEEIYQNSRHLFGSITEQMQNMKLIKTHALEPIHLSRIHQANHDITHVQVLYAKLQGITKLYFDVGAVIVFSLFFYISISFFHISISTLLVLLLVFSRLMPRVSSLQQTYQNIINLMPTVSYVHDYRDECLREREYIEYDANNKIILQDAIHLKNVSFRYDSANERVALNQLNFSIPARKTTAIVGHSGAGKSTLADILVGLFKPETGEIYLDNTLLDNDSLGTWRQSVSYVTQDTYLFHDSIYNNLIWSNPSASENEIWHALENASLANLVRKLPQGLNTIIGDRGVKLSGGERQRLALARALLRKPTFIILDEATSSLDSENERHIQAAVENLYGAVTMVIIAHRLSTIRNADTIIVLEEGEIKECGNWQELVAKENGVFKQLLSHQPAGG